MLPILLLLRQLVVVIVVVTVAVVIVVANAVDVFTPVVPVVVVVSIENAFVVLTVVLLVVFVDFMISISSAAVMPEASSRMEALHSTALDGAETGKPQDSIPRTETESSLKTSDNEEVTPDGL